MSFPHRRPCQESREAMSRAAACLGTEGFDARDEAERAKKALAGVTGHSRVELLSSGDAALMLVLKSVVGGVIIPDQGGWKGFRTLPRLFGLSVYEAGTQLGVINPESLAEDIRKEKPGAVLLSSFAGYIAEQPLKEIHRVCAEAGVLLVEDASGAVGDPVLSRGENADVIVGSMGAPKVLNLHSGGFISTDRTEILESSRELLRACRISPVTCAGIVNELRQAPDVVRALTRSAEAMKEELTSVLHRERRGICVGLELRNPGAAAEKAYRLGLKTSQGSPLLTKCPNYNRFLRPGLAVELKKLDILRAEEDIPEISKVIGRIAKV